MAGYFVANYTITNQAEYKDYLAAVEPVSAARRRSPTNPSSTATQRRWKDLAGQVTVVLR